MLPFVLGREPNAPFPSPLWALPDGLLAVGGDLAPERLYRAYREGIFPWYSEGEPILWWSPEPRWVLHEFHISRSFTRFLKRCDWTISLDRDFGAVLAGCATGRAEGTWITPAMAAAYLTLHQQGLAHSLEVWNQGQLVGGLYGVAVGGIFCAESMFSRASNGSKVALLALAENFRQLGGALIDCQLYNDHIASLGIEPLARSDYLAVLQAVRDRADPLTHLPLTQAQALLTETG